MPYAPVSVGGSTGLGALGAIPVVGEVAGAFNLFNTALGAITGTWEEQMKEYSDYMSAWSGQDPNAVQIYSLTQQIDTLRSQLPSISGAARDTAVASLEMLGAKLAELQAKQQTAKPSSTAQSQTPTTSTGQAQPSTEQTPSGVPNASGAGVSPQTGILPAVTAAKGLLGTITGGGGGGGSKESQQLSQIEQQQVALSKEQIGLAQTLESLSLPQLQQYIAYLNKLISSDPNVRFSAIAPAAQDVTAQYEASRKNIELMPRSGERDYLLAQTYQGQARDIGRLIDESYTSAQAAKGQIGQYGIGAAAGLLGGGGVTLGGAAQTAFGTEQLAAQRRAEELAAIGSIIKALASGGTTQYGAGTIYGW